MTTENTAIPEDVVNAANAANAAAEEKTTQVSPAVVLGWVAATGFALGFVTQLAVNAFSSTDTTTNS